MLILRETTKSIVLALVLFAISIFGQTSAATSNLIKGRVVDPNQAAVAGAKVTAHKKFGTSAVQTQTNSDGEYEFQNLTVGDYRIIIEVGGFSPASREITVGNTQQTLDVELTVGDLSETVTVTATRTQISTDETAVPTSVVGRDLIERKAVNTVGDVFRTLPGTSTVNEGAFQVRPRIRGLDSNRVLILVDGERLNNSRTSTAQSGIEIGLVETSQVETLEVVRGSGSVLYGTDALAGTINIITRDTPARREKGFRFGGTLDTFYSTNEKGRRGSLSVNGSGRFFAFRASQSLDRFQNFFTGNLNNRIVDGVATTDGEVLNSQSHGGNTQVTARFFVNDTNTLRLNYERRRAANIGSASLVGTFNAFFPFSDRDKFSGRYDTVNLTKNLLRLSINGYYQKQQRNFTNIVTVPPAPPFFPGVYQFSETVTDTATSGFDLQTDWAFGGRNNLTAGVSFFRDTNNDNRVIITAATAASTNQTRNTSKSVPDASLSSIAAFAQNEFRVTNRVKLIGGIRIDSLNTKAQPTNGFAIPPTFTQNQIEDLGLAGLTSGLSVRSTSVTGDFGVILNATKNIILSSRIGRSFRAPNIFERFFTDFGSTAGFVVGNPNLKPESGINFDTTAKLRTSKFVASITYFNNYFKDFLSNQVALDRNGAAITIARPPRAPIPVSQTINIAKARIQGFEADLNHRSASVSVISRPTEITVIYAATICKPTRRSILSALRAPTSASAGKIPPAIILPITASASSANKAVCRKPFASPILATNPVSCRTI